VNPAQRVRQLAEPSLKVIANLRFRRPRSALGSPFEVGPSIGSADGRTPARAVVPAHRGTSQWPPAWLTNVGFVIGLGLIVLVSSLAIGVAATSMTEHGVSAEDLQSAGTSAKAEQAYGDLGEDGRRAAWWFSGSSSPSLSVWSAALRRLRLRRPPTRRGRSRAPCEHYPLCRDLQFARRGVRPDPELRSRCHPRWPLRPAGPAPRRGLRVTSPGFSASRPGSSSSQVGSTQRFDPGKPKSAQLAVALCFGTS
jgi:hypothetical protein